MASDTCSLPIGDENSLVFALGGDNSELTKAGSDQIHRGDGSDFVWDPQSKEEFERRWWIGEKALFFQVSVLDSDRGSSECKGLQVDPR